MMTILMYCDHCGDEIPAEINGGVRVRTGNRELSFHLCGEHQNALRDLVHGFCGWGSVREVPTSLKR